MSRRLMASALFVAGLLAVAGFAQPPANVDPKTAVKKAEPKKAVDPLDGLIGAALTNDAEVKMAQAKLQLADAEVARARQQVTHKVIALDSSVREQKKLVATSEQLFAISDQAYKQKQGSFQELLFAREKLEVAQSKLAQLETELKLMTGGGPVRVGASAGWNDLDKAHAVGALATSCVACHTPQVGLSAGKAKVDLSASTFLFDEFHVPFKVKLRAPAGPISDRIRGAMDKVVKLGAKDEKVTFEQALETFKKDAGLDVPVRVDAKTSAIISLGEELPVGAWLQLFADGTPDTRILVREYGLLVTNKELNPPDAISVFEFWKQKPEKKAEK